LSKRFGAKEVLRGISIDVDDGEFCILLGPSGCGKSTVLRLIAGLELPSGGEIVMDGGRIDRQPPQQRDVAFVFQNYALYPHMTVFDNLAFSLRLRGDNSAEITAKVEDAARLLEIAELLDRRPQALSGGQRQRVALGRAIVRRPRIFLFDEPLSNLDAALRATMRVELARLHRRLGATIVYVTHDQAEALTLGQKIVVLDGGKIQQVGAPAEIYHRPANIMVARFVGSPQMNLFDGEVDALGEAFHGRGRSLPLAGELRSVLAQHAGRRLTLGVRPEDFVPVDADRGWLHGEIELIEDLGSDRFLHIRLGETDLVVRADREHRFQAGQPIGIDIAAKKLHVFENGKRLGS
jgi:ABC-type sugar transport system ATPase subunit